MLICDESKSNSNDLDCLFPLYRSHAEIHRQQLLACGYWLESWRSISALTNPRSSNYPLWSGFWEFFYSVNV